MPDGDINVFKPTTPRSMSSSSTVSLCAFWGTSPPQKATSTCSLPLDAAILPSNVAASQMVGYEFSGMSTTVVTPPAAAALVPVSKPSHSSRPGSFRWTWTSTRPGEMASLP